MAIQRYVVNMKHRGGAPTENASKWYVGDWEEVFLCSEAAVRGWSGPSNLLWNTKGRAGSKLVPLGVDTLGEVYLSKFVKDNNDEWHGYPVRARGPDIPPSSVIRAWVNAGRIDLTDSRRIARGKL
jgi:hypothetical protein